MKLNKQKISIIYAQKGLTRKEIAVSYGCSVNRISTIINSGSVRPETAKKLADALGVELLEIVES